MLSSVLNVELTRVPQQYIWPARQARREGLYSLLAYNVGTTFDFATIHLFIFMQSQNSNQESIYIYIYHCTAQLATPPVLSANTPQPDNGSHPVLSGEFSPVAPLALSSRIVSSTVPCPLRSPFIISSIS